MHASSYAPHRFCHTSASSPVLIGVQVLTTAPFLAQVRAAPVSSHFSELAAVLSGVQLVAFAPPPPRLASEEMRLAGGETSATATGGALHSGALHSGVLHSGALHSGALHSGALHSGALHSGALNSGTATSGGASVSGGAHQPISWFVQHGLLNATYLDIEQYLPEGKYSSQ